MTAGKNAMPDSIEALPPLLTVCFTKDASALAPLANGSANDPAAAQPPAVSRHPLRAVLTAIQPHMLDSFQAIPSTAPRRLPTNHLPLRLLLG